jgi:steroid delta-isomerase-like uncharacterized protein
MTTTKPPRNNRATKLRQLTERWMELLWRQGNLDAIDQLHAPDFVDRSSAGRPPDNDGFREGLRAFFQAFPDFHAVTEDLVVEARTGKVAVRWSAVATHRGLYLGAAPTGRRITFRGIEILRFRRDRLVERWGEWDGLDLLEQLGQWD